MSDSVSEVEVKKAKKLHQIPLSTLNSAFSATTNVVMSGANVGLKLGTTTANFALHTTTNAVKSGANVGRKGLKTTGKMVFKTGATAGKLVGLRRKQNTKNSHRAWDSRVSAAYIKVNLTIECKNLPNKDSFSKSDAFCCIWEAPPGFREQHKHVGKLPSKLEGKELGRSEIIKQNNNPTFQTPFPVDYRFEAEQNFVVRVYSEDLRYSTDLKEHDFLGGCIFSLGELLGSPGCAIARRLEHVKSFLVITGTEVKESREVLEFRFSGQNLGLLERKNKRKVAKEMLEKMQKANVAKHLMDQLEKFDPYFRLERLNKDDQSWITIWKSEVIKDSMNPTWQQARLPLQYLCNDDLKAPLKISIWIWNRFSNDELIGFVETTVDELVKKAQRGIPIFDVLLERKKILGGIKLRKAGVLKVLKGKVLQIPSMLEFIAGGCQLDLMVGVDCSSANRDWREEKSLHFHSDSWLNDYQAAIYRLGAIFDSYSSRNDYALWGYGASINGVRQPYFSLSKDKLRSADDMVRAYDDFFSPENEGLVLEDHANLKHIIQAAMFRAQNAKNEGRQRYSVLVILTTGAITDLQDSIDAICTAAEDAPLSIAVIGIGDNDFSGIHLLEGDEKGNKLRHSNNVPVAREIVTFASMEEFRGNARLCCAEAMLEIPEHFVQYYMNSGSMPYEKLPAPDFAKRMQKSRSKARKSKKSSTSNKKHQ